MSGLSNWAIIRIVTVLSFNLLIKDVSILLETQATIVTGRSKPTIAVQVS